MSQLMRQIVKNKLLVSYVAVVMVQSTFISLQTFSQFILKSSVLSDITINWIMKHLTRGREIHSPARLGECKRRRDQ